MGNPTVSIVCISYNQEKYIAEAIEGFLAQQTDFNFEIIIADDYSKDNTQAIIQKKATAHPDRFNLILRKQNIGIQKNLYDALQHAKGKYIALCEGDDYWIDSRKLQKQVDLLDKNPSFGLCFHPVKVIFEDSNTKEYIYPDIKQKKSFSREKLLKENFIQTNSVMYRRSNYKNLPEDILPLDWFLHLYHAQSGEVGFIDQTMAVYRRHEGGVWWSSHRNIDEIWRKHGLSHMRLYAELFKLYGEKENARHIIFGHICKLLNNLSKVDQKDSSDLYKKALAIISAHKDTLFEYQVFLINELETSLNEKQNEQIKLREELNQKETIISEKNKQIDLIKSSRLWKARNKVAKYVGRKPV